MNYRKKRLSKIEKALCKSLADKVRAKRAADTKQRERKPPTTKQEDREDV